jgi:hypothetical protein
MRQILPFTFALSVAVLSGGGGSVAQPISIFSNAVPNNPINMTYAADTLGVKFWSSEPGMILGILFYRAVECPQGYVAQLYSANGTLLGSATLAQESGPLPGWQEATFPSPIPISANVTYLGTYYCSIGQGPADPSGLRYGVTNGPLTAPASRSVGGNGVYNSADGFPTSSYEASNYYVDVAFEPAAGTSPFLVLSFNPPNPSITSAAPLGSVVTTVIASWSDGSPFTGTLSFGPPYSNDQGVFAISGSNLIINPNGPGVSSDANTTLNVTIVATQ